MSSGKNGGDKRQVDLFSNEDTPMEEETFIENSSSSLFEIAVGHIEDIFVDDKFQQVQEQFMKEHCVIFEDSEENKLEYSTIHAKYGDVIEKFIEGELKRRMPNYTMKDFEAEVMQRGADLEGEVFEMLHTFSDFLAFKEMMVDYKKAMNGEMADLSLGMIVTPLSARDNGGGAFSNNSPASFSRNSNNSSSSPKNRNPPSKGTSRHNKA